MPPIGPFGQELSQVEERPCAVWGARPPTPPNFGLKAVDAAPRSYAHLALCAFRAGDGFGCWPYTLMALASPATQRGPAEICAPRAKSHK